MNNQQMKYLREFVRSMEHKALDKVPPIPQNVMREAAKLRKAAADLEAPHSAKIRRERERIRAKCSALRGGLLFMSGAEGLAAVKALGKVLKVS